MVVAGIFRVSFIIIPPRPEPTRPACVATRRMLRLTMSQLDGAQLYNRKSTKPGMTMAANVSSSDDRVSASQRVLRLTIPSSHRFQHPVRMVLPHITWAPHRARPQEVSCLSHDVRASICVVRTPRSRKSSETFPKDPFLKPVVAASINSFARLGGCMG